MAANAIQQAIEKWNNKRAWTFLLVEAPEFGIDPSLGQDYLLAPDFATPYAFKTTVNKRVLGPMTQREYLWSDPYGAAGTPYFYGIFNLGGLGKVRFYPSPVSADSVLHHYYRKMAIPMESQVTGASCSTVANRLTLTGTVTTSGSNLVTTTAGAGGIYVGEVITHANVTAGTTVTKILSDTSFLISANANATGSATATIGLLLVTATAGTFNGVRLGAAATSGGNLTAGSTVYRIIDTGTIQLSVAAPAAFSNQAITFDSTNQLLDIPADFERGIISLAKYYYLNDKGGAVERLQGWKNEADAGFKEAIEKDNTITDEQLSFQPGYLSPQNMYPMSPQDIRWAWTDF